MEAANLALRFLLELAALGSLGWWGWNEGGIALALLCPLAFAAVWGLFVSPKARVRVPRPAWWALNVVLFGLAALALGSAWSVAAGVVFAVVALANLLMLAAFGKLA